MKNISYSLILLALLVGGYLLWSRSAAPSAPSAPQATVSALPPDIPEEALRVLEPQRAIFPKQEVAVSIRMLLGREPLEEGFPEVWASLQQLKANELSTAEITHLRALLHGTEADFPSELRLIERNALKNHIIGMLIDQTDRPEGVAEELAEMATNSALDMAWRNYCVQFLGLLHERMAQEIAREEAPPDVKAQQALIEKTLMHTLEEDELAGSALIALEHMVQTKQGLSPNKLLDQTLEIVEEIDMPVASRITALRMAATLIDGSRDETQLGTAARELSQTSESILLRCAAIITLGECGSSEDRELLESYLQSSVDQLAEAAQLALQRMDAR